MTKEELRLAFGNLIVDNTHAGGQDADEVFDRVYELFESNRLEKLIIKEDAEISQAAKYCARDLKQLGYIPTIANYERKVKFTDKEIDWIAKETGISAYKIFMKYG